MNEREKLSIPYSSDKTPLATVEVKEPSTAFLSHIVQIKLSFIF